MKFIAHGDEGFFFRIFNETSQNLCDGALGGADQLREVFAGELSLVYGIGDSGSDVFLHQSTILPVLGIIIVYQFLDIFSSCCSLFDTGILTTAFFDVIIFHNEE